MKILFIKWSNYDVRLDNIFSKMIIKMHKNTKMIDLQHAKNTKKLKLFQQQVLFKNDW